MTSRSAVSLRATATASSSVAPATNRFTSGSNGPDSTMAFTRGDRAAVSSVDLNMTATLSRDAR